MDQEKYKDIRAKSWKQAKIALIGVGIVIVILAIMAVLGSSGGSRESTTDEVSNQTTSETIAEINIQVSSQIIKKVGSKYRYFFLITNEDSKDFSGKVKLTLYNSKGTRLAEDTFETQLLKSGLSSSVSLDANTGPDGEFGLKSYSFVAASDNQTVAQGEGVLTTNFEDLSDL